MKEIYFDIETTGLEVGEGDIITSIQYRIDDKKLVVVNANEVPAGLHRDDVEILYKSEKDMLIHFAEMMRGEYRHRLEYYTRQFNKSFVPEGF